MKPSYRLFGALALVGTALGSVGCYASVDPPVAYAEVSEAPVDVEVTSYPQTTYEGRVVYYHNNRWYYRDGARWAYYRHEPTVLRQRRYVRTAPRARRN
jgi:hypothetical protein